MVKAKLKVVRDKIQAVVNRT
jgi:hypothetical protein